jgi:hypothetical protein
MREHRPTRELILDMDSSVSETYGEQGGTAYNGHFGCPCCHPLFCFIKSGAKGVCHARQVVFQMAEVAVPRELFRTILERIGRLRVAIAMSG